MPGFEPGSSRYEADSIPMCYRASVSVQVLLNRKNIYFKQIFFCNLSIQENLAFSEKRTYSLVVGGNTERTENQLFLRALILKFLYLKKWCSKIVLGSYTPVSVPYSLFTPTNLKVSHTAQPTTLFTPSNINLSQTHEP